MTSKTLVLALVAASLAVPGMKAQRKELIQLQRDMALLQDALRQLEQQNAEMRAGIEALLRQSTEKQDKLTAGQAVIERKLATLDDALTEPQRSTSAKVDSLMSQFSALRGTVEEISKQQERIQGDVRDVKTHLTTLPPPMEGAEGADTDTAGLNASETTFESAMSDYLRGSLDLARGQFQDYLALYPTHSRASEAQYYLAETYYGAADYEEAARQFDVVYKKYPLSKLAADSVYKRGMCLLMLRNEEEGAKVLQSVLDRFPQSEVAQHARTELFRLENSKPSPSR